MVRTALLTGGPHPFAETTPILRGLLVDAGCAVTVFDDPDLLARHLESGEVEMVVANTLRWRMLADRYADRRGAHAYATAPETAEAVDGWVRGGGRLLACHGAPVCFDDWPGWGELLGARWNWARSSHPPLAPIDVHVSHAEHPLVAGLSDFTVTDECYGFLDFVGGFEVTPLLTAEHGGAVHPLLWTRTVGEGHVVVCLLGHGPESFRHPTHAEVLRRAVGWLCAAVEPDTKDRP